MAIGIDDEMFEDELEDIVTPSTPPSQEPQGGSTEEIEENGNQPNLDPTPPPTEKDFISQLLELRGIEDKTKITFEDEEGNSEERSWDDLTDEEKFNILQTSTPTDDLDDAELDLIHTIRQSGLTPSEYIQLMEKNGVDRYIQNAQGDEYHYNVDDYSDDELFIADIMGRMPDMTEEEAQQALEMAKSNEALFTKQIGALRAEYKIAEQEEIRQQQFEEQQNMQAQFEQFTGTVVDQINAMDEISGYDLNLEDDDKQELYDFITGADAAGNNYFAKALSDPKILVRTAWFALNGEQMINDITSYFQKEIKNVSKQSYEKGLADGKEKADKSRVVFKPKNTKPAEQTFADLDDFE